MPRPVLLVIDEDQLVLDDVAAQLAQRYGETSMPAVLAAGDGASAASAEGR